MRRTTMLLLAVCVGLGLLAYWQATSLRQQRQQVQQLSAKLDSMSNVASLDLQEKCAKQAHEEFLILGWGKYTAAVFANHYNQKLNRCFMQVERSDVMGTWKTVSDAFEGKVYAVLGSYGDQVKKCSVTLPSGEERICHSSDEFNALVKQYME